MNRRKFIQSTSIVATGLALAPQLISASTNSEKNKVILVILSGGIRLQDAMNETNMPLFFSKENGLCKKGVLFNNAYYSGTEVTHSHAKYALLNGTTKIDNNFLNQPWQSKISSGYAYIYTDLKDNEKIFQSYNYAANVDGSNFIVINADGADVAHYNFTEYKNHLKRVDEFLANIYKMNVDSKQEFTLLVVSEHGRNKAHNSMGGLDHYQTEARNTFAWLASSDAKIKQGTVIDKIIDSTETMLFCESRLQKKSSTPTLNLNLAFA